MPATPARIGFIREEFRRATATTPSVKTAYDNLARESDDPVPTWFYSVGDAQVVATERQALLSGHARLFSIGASGLDEALAVGYVGAVPLAHVTDTERAVDRDMLVAGMVIDFETQRATFNTWG